MAEKNKIELEVGLVNKTDVEADLENRIETFASKVQYILVAISIVIFLGAIGETLLYFQLKDTAKDNEAAVAHLCGTSGSLASVLKSAADSIQTSLENGSYDRLVAQGILTQEDVNRAISTRDRYRETVTLLTRPNNPCSKGM